MPLLQLLQPREDDQSEVTSLDRQQYVSKAEAVLEGLRPLRFSSTELSLLCSIALDAGFRLVDVELGITSRGPLPEVGKELEGQIVLGIRDHDWRRVQRALEDFPDEFFIQWIELEDRDSGDRVRLSRHGVVNIPVESATWEATLSRVERLASERPFGMGFVST